MKVVVDTSVWSLPLICKCRLQNRTMSANKLGTITNGVFINRFTDGEPLEVYAVYA